MADFPAHLFRMDGDPGAIRASAGKWSSFGVAASNASAQITGLDTGAFVGPEGDMFRDGLNKDMPRHLSITGDAFGRVSRALTTFADTLGSLQDQMRPLAARAPGLWEALQSARGRASRAATADAAHDREMAARAPEDNSPDRYRSDSAAAGSALSAAQAEWDATVASANGLRGQMNTAASEAVRTIKIAKDMRFKENPKWWNIGGQFQNFVRDNKDLLQKLSGALKIVSLVAGLLSFIPVLAPIMGPIALGTALLASAIDLSIYAATGEGSLKTILIDVGLNLLPGVGKLASRGITALRGGGTVARASGSMDVLSRTRHYGNASAADFARDFPDLAHGVNPRFGNAPGFDINCQSCVVATDRSLGGAPTSAIGRPVDAAGHPLPDQRFNWPHSVNQALDGNNPVRPANGYDDIASELENAGDGARGIVHGMRVDANGNPVPGHVFNAVNRGGTVHFVDGQIGGYAYLENYSGFQFMRTS
jgi:hypothetical protein